MERASGGLSDAAAAEILARLKYLYPKAKSGLNYTTPFELLVATILSAQCTDARVNKVTAQLFGKANTPEGILALGREKLESIIRECGLFRSKAGYIMEACQILLSEYGGEVPADFESLMRLPGVGRKTASVILSNAFGIPAMPVDTHVFRVSNRLGLAKGKTPREVEEGLKELLPQDEWNQTHHLLIRHGREICKARNPGCQICPLRDLCISVQQDG
ncbi:MAG: endonuclease III [Firmicutes bacterium]|nr:endonuclease III [Bacillota bacterium]